MEAAAKPPSAFCPALAALLACLLVGINQAAALPIAISVFPFSRQPVLIAACAINILGTLIGLIGSSASLCCSTLWCTSPFCARGLLATSAAIFVSMGGVMAYGCVNACAYAIRARPDDWLAWVDGDGQSWRYVDRCSGDRYTFLRSHSSSPMQCLASSLPHSASSYCSATGASTPSNRECHQDSRPPPRATIRAPSPSLAPPSSSSWRRASGRE